MRRIARTSGIYFAIVVAGAAIATYGGNARWTAFGLGAMIPGAGFLAGSDPGITNLAAAALGFGCFLLAVLLWFATGNVLAPPLAWLLAALIAAATSDGIARPGVVAHALAVIFVAMASIAIAASIRRVIGRRQRRAANQYLATTGIDVAASFARTAGDAPEFTPQDLKLMRFVLDRALQPVETFHGFEWLDQYQTAAVRYQLNFLAYGLAMAQATRLPALGGYLDEAQRRLIVKQTDHRIWRYWALENLWGNLDFDPNPLARDNIMYSGFCALQIALFQAASGCRDFSRRGSFSLFHPSGRIYASDLPAMVEGLDHGYRRSDFHLIACEPNWIYPLCNTIGATAMRAQDAQAGEHRWTHHAGRFRRQLESEFVDLAGQIIPCRSVHTGFAFPMSGGAQPQAMASFFLNASLPDLALRQWLLLRRDMFTAGAGPAALDRRRFWRIDVGNYGFSRAAAYAGTALAAIELGDDEVATLCLAAIEEECPASVADDAFHRPNASVWSHATEFFARSGAHNALRNLVERPRNTAPRPTISEIRYPDVLVASAQSVSGAGLRAVLYPGRTDGPQQISLSGLVPGRTYGCTGTRERNIAADKNGNATVRVMLAGRTEFQIHPVL